jgi:hypothetical protein
MGSYVLRQVDLAVPRTVAAATALYQLGLTRTPRQASDASAGSGVKALAATRRRLLRWLDRVETYDPPPPHTHTHTHVRARVRTFMHAFLFRAEDAHRACVRAHFCLPAYCACVRRQIRHGAQMGRHGGGCHRARSV